jgi:subtilase family serine protease
MPNRPFAAKFAASLATLLLTASFATAQKSLVQPRILTAIDDSARVTLPNTRSPHALPANDLGPIPGDTALPGITLVFNRSAAQQAALEALIVAQQDPASPQYHQWLTPAQFGAQFGLADSDLTAAKSWLEARGFTVLGVSPSRDRITVSGTAAQASAAFGTSLHNFKSPEETEAHFAPATDLSLPAALAANVLAVNNLSSFRVKPHTRLQPAFTSSQTGTHYIQPGDITTIYDVNAAYNSGYTGTGVSIAIAGQTAVSNTDINNFQTAAGLPIKNPTQIIVPNSGASTTYSGDLAESDLDLEYSSAIAKGANVYFVYTGNNGNYGVFDSLNYAVQQDLAPILSISYGACEPALGSTNIATLDAIAQQAATQGQTILASSGDDGSTDCQQVTSATSAVRYSLAVDYPASSAYVTGIGGTEFLLADTASGNSTYFTAASGSDVVASAKSYIPEMVWNDDSSTSTGLSSGGGGTSIYSARPSWQTGSFAGVAIPTGSYRLVPDISLDASNYSAAYLFCTSDTTAYATGQVASCNSGFRDASSQDLTRAGGTSFSAPIFAGMLALIVQAKGGAGLGLINPTLYTLAANTSTYGTAFHDITTGSNDCLASASVCTGAGVTTSYAATTGYDLASGLGSIDLNNLLTLWPNPSPTLSASSVTLTPNTTTPAPGATDNITIRIASAGTGILTPTGTVAVRVDGGSATTLNLIAGVTTYGFSSTVSGPHTVTAVYSGDSIYKQSSASTILTVSGSFSISAPGITVKAGSSGTSVVTVTPSGGYTGTVAFVASASSALTNACYTISNATVTSAAAATTTLTLYTSATTCSTVVNTGIQAFRVGGSGGHASLWTPPTPTRQPSRVPALAAVSGAMLLLTLLRRRKLGARLAAATLSLGLLLALGLGLTGCSSSTSSISGGGGGSTGNYTPTGSYTITLTGADANNGTLTASTNLTLTVQ